MSEGRRYRGEVTIHPGQPTPPVDDRPFGQEGPGRLDTLRRYEILDTAPEAAFDRAAALAARLLRVPIALVSLVDERRQWFKACFGLDLRQTDRSLSFCAHAIAAPGMLVVPDATLDPRFADNALVTGSPHIRFYAGAPLEAPNGHKLGTLCILDTAPRPDLTPDERATLQDLAAGVVSELELRRALNERGHSEALKTAVLESALDSVIGMDREGRVFEWNPAAERTFGYTRAEAVGRELSALIIPERLREAHRRGMAHYLRSGEGPVLGRRVEVPALRRDGSEFPCELAITPFALGGELRFTAYLRDLTERKRAEEDLATSHNLLRAVVDGVPESIFVKDLRGRYVLINAAGARRIGRPPEEILGRDDHALFAPSTAHALREYDQRVLASSQALSYEAGDPTPDQPFRTFLTTKQVYRDGQGQVAGLIGTSLDITQRKVAEHLIQEHNQLLEERVHARTREVEQTQFEMIDRLARAAEHRDDETGEHVRRVSRLAGALARALGLPGDDVALIERVTPLHDVGKIGVPDTLLLKPGRLTPEEFERIKAHALIGGSILAGSASRLVRAAQEVALSHHERWDGSGYPHGRAGEAIPLFGRIVAVADVLDALLSERPYKQAWPLDQALAEIRAQAGRQFDPRVVGALERVLAEGITAE